MDIFDQYLPPVAVPHARQLWEQYPFRFRVVPPRRTRFGDFKAFPDGQVQITVNADLSPPAFLLTYIHEVAHRLVYHQYKEARQHQPKTRKASRMPRPHGTEWQQAFQQLMAPVLTEAIFSADALTILRRYMARPAATLSRHPELARLLRPAAPMGSSPVLRQLPEGQAFRLGKKSFVRGKLRRSRIVCMEIATGRNYAILADVAVAPHD